MKRTFGYENEKYFAATLWLQKPKLLCSSFILIYLRKKDNVIFDLKLLLIDIST